MQCPETPAYALRDIAMRAAGTAYADTDVLRGHVFFG